MVSPCDRDLICHGRVGLRRSVAANPRTKRRPSLMKTIMYVRGVVVVPPTDVVNVETCGAFCPPLKTDWPAKVLLKEVSIRGLEERACTSVYATR